MASKRLLYNISAFEDFPKRFETSAVSYTVVYERMEFVVGVS